MYSYYLLRGVIGELYASLIPIMISISCLKTTQHLLLDVIFGVIYSYIMFNFVLKKLNPEVFK